MKPAEVVPHGLASREFDGDRPTGNVMDFTRLQIAALTAALALVCIFGAFPRLDIAITGLFADGQGQFPLTTSRLVNTVNDVLKAGLFVFFLAACVFALTGWRPRFMAFPDRRSWWFLVTAFLIGPGLIVNGFLKAYAGRARPAHVSEFGGDKVFTPILQFSDQCARNCSFTSGEVAMTATFTFALMMLAWPHLARNGRRVAVLAGVGLICLSILLRVGMGRHFMSDALASVAISAFVVLVAYRLFNFARTRQSRGAA